MVPRQILNRQSLTSKEGQAAGGDEMKILCTITLTLEK
ncbi:hypothetical protein AVEN_199862-1, partial [Araneus ventricosus]